VRVSSSERKVTATTRFAEKEAVVEMAEPTARISSARYSDWYQQRWA
jgi:hypothetical protein